MQEKKIHSIINSLRQRFSIDQISKEHYYIKNMNKKLQIKINVFKQDPMFQSKSQEQVRHILKNISQFQVLSNKVIIKYPNQDRTVILTGIKIQFLRSWISQFTQNPKQQFSRARTNGIKNISYKNNWSIVEFENSDMARVFQGFIRGKKVKMDEKFDSMYKIQRKRVRIILLNEDFHTILTDFMLEEESKVFMSCFGKKQPYKYLEYYPIYMNHSCHRFQEENDDNFSEGIKSRSSEMYEARNFEGLIETKNQGSQYEKIEETKDIKKMQLENIEQTQETLGISTQNTLEKVEVAEKVQQIETPREIGRKQQMKKVEQEKKIENQKVNEKIQLVQLPQYTHAELKTKIQQYKSLKKQRAYDIPSYIRKECDKFIFRGKFFEKIIQLGKAKNQI